MGNGDGTGERPQYNPDCGAYQLHLDTDDEEELSSAIVSAVSAVTGVPIEEVGLNEVVHPGALNRLFSNRRDGTPREGGELVFVLAGCEVMVKGYGEIVLAPPEDSRSNRPDLDD